MSIYHKPNLATNFEHGNLFLDTNVIIGALYSAELLKILKDFRENNCELLSIPSVFFEFTRGGGSIEGFNNRAEFYDSLVATWPIEKLIDTLEEVIVILQKLSPGMSYTDFLLAACCYKFDAYLFTEDHSDFPTSVFDRIELVTVDNQKGIKNYGIYYLSKDKFNKAAAKILGNKS